MSNVRRLVIPEAAMRAIEHASIQDDNSEHKPPGGGGTGGSSMEVRISKLEGIAEKTSASLVAIEKDVAVFRSQMDGFAKHYATKEDVSRLEGSMHKEFTAQTWRIIGAMLTFGSMLTAITYFIARNVK